MSFETDPSLGYFVRKVTVPVKAEGGIEDGMLRIASTEVSSYI